MQQHPGHQRYGPQGGPQGPPGTHRPVPGRTARGPEHQGYYDQQGAQRGRGPGYRGGRGGPVQGPHHPDAQQVNKRARWFVALYDYDPPTMSPNPDACEIELPFSEGDTIKVTLFFY